MKYLYREDLATELHPIGKLSYNLACILEADLVTDSSKHYHSSTYIILVEFHIQSNYQKVWLWSCK